MSPFQRNLTLWLVIVLFILAIVSIFNQPKESHTEILYSDFTDAISSGNIDEVRIQGKIISGVFTDGGKFQTFTPDDPQLLSMLREKGVRINVRPPEQNSWYMGLFVSWFPMLLLIGVWIFFMRQMQSGGNKAMSFGKSKAKPLHESKTNITFKDVAGADEAKEELEEIIEFLKTPQKFTKLGGKLPKGVLLMGPPGTGKTLLAKAVAGEAERPFFSISGSDFVEMFVGVGASRVRDLFEQGKKNAPCIIFIDEIDAVGRHRGAGLGGGNDEREQTLNQLLVEMDGFEGTDGVILVAATNRPDVLDPALLRPGRFDRQVVVAIPDVRGREGILKVHAEKVPLDKSVDLKVIARGTPGFSGADLANLINEAALLAASQDHDIVKMEHFEEAKDKVMMGKERRSAVISEKEKISTAYHEVGHAIVGMCIPGADPLHKVTIIPRGRALGLTQQLPEEEKHTHTRDYLLTQVAILMGGRAAEQLFLGEMTTGAGNDIERATDLARKMVCSWGMSDKMGPLSFGKKEEQLFLGREIQNHQNYSEVTAKHIDDEVTHIVKDGMERARKLLEDNKDKAEEMTQALLEKETLTGNEARSILHGGEPKSEDKPDGGSPVKAEEAPPAKPPTKTEEKGTGIGGNPAPLAT